MRFIKNEQSVDIGNDNATLRSQSAAAIPCHLSTVLLPPASVHLLYWLPRFIIQDYRRENDSKTQVFYVPCETQWQKKCWRVLCSAICEHKFPILKCFEVRNCEQRIPSTRIYRVVNLNADRKNESSAVSHGAKSNI